MPVSPAGSGRSTSSFSRLTSFPAFLAAASPPSASTATPAESYPRYSSRFSPAITTSSADCDPTYPTIPHMRGSLGAESRRNTALRARFRILRQGAGAGVTPPPPHPVQTPLTMDCDLSGLPDAPEPPPAQAGGDSLRRPHPRRVERAAREDAAPTERRRGREAARPR